MDKHRKRRRMRNYRRTSLGLRLIKLTVAVAVIIAIAIFAVKFFSGKGEVVDTATSAKDEKELKTEIEMIDLVAAQAKRKSKNGSIKKEELEEALTKNAYSDAKLVEDYKEGELYFIEFEKTKSSYKVSYKGDVEYLGKVQEAAVLVAKTSGKVITEDNVSEIGAKIKTFGENVKDEKISLTYAWTDSEKTKPEESSYSSATLGTVNDENERKIEGITIPTDKAGGKYFLWLKAVVGNNTILKSFGPYTVENKKTKENETKKEDAEVKTNETKDMNATEFDVNFSANGGEGGQKDTVKAVYDKDMPAILETAPKRDGYEFMGWYDAMVYTAGTQYYTASGQSARKYDKRSNSTLYAGWKANVLVFASQNKTLKFSDKEQTIVLSEANGGTGAYKYAKKSEKNGKDKDTSYFSINESTITVASNTPAGTYTCIIEVTDTNTNITKETTITVKIEKIENPLEVKAKAGLMYDTTSQELITQENIQGDIYYSLGTELNTGNYLAYGKKNEIPKAKDAKKYIVYYFVPENSNYTAKKGNVEVTIEKYNLSNANMAQGEMNYSGVQLKPTPTVSVNIPTTSNQTILAEGIDFIYVYGENINAGINTGSIMIKAKEGTNYTGEKVTNFSINKIANTLTVTGKNIVYNTTAQELVKIENPQGDVYYSIGTELSAYNYETAGVKGVIPKETNVGSYTIYYYTLGTINYNSTSGHVNSEISKYDLKNARIDQGPMNYTGSALNPKPQVIANIPNENNPTKLIEDTDFTFSYGENTNAGKGSVTIKAKGNTNFTGTKTITFDIKRLINPLKVEGRTGLTYNTSLQDLVTQEGLQGDIYYSVKTKLTAENYEKEGSKNIIPKGTNAKKYVIYYYAPGNENYSPKSGQVETTIGKYNLSNAKIEQEAIDYTGKTLKPKAKVTVPIPSANAPTILEEGTHFTFSYGANIDAGTNSGKITISAKDKSNYAGTKTESFAIKKIANTLVVAPKLQIDYKESPQEIVTQENAQGDVYYSTITELTSENYSTVGNKNVIPKEINVGKYKVYYYTPGNNNYNQKAGSVEANIVKATMAKPKISVEADGRIVWDNVLGATSYEISDNNADWKEVRNGEISISTISTGIKTVYVRALSKNANYNPVGDVGDKTISICSLTLKRGTGIASTKGERNYVSGTQINIDATVSTGYVWSRWVKIEGTEPTNGKRKNATIVINENTVLEATSSPAELIFKDKTVNKDYSLVPQTIENAIDIAEGGTGTYIYTIKEGNDNNYFNLNDRDLNIKANTPGGTYELIIEANDTTTGSHKRAKYKVIINRIENTIKVTGKSGLVYTGKVQELVTHSDLQGDVFYSVRTKLKASNYLISGTRMVTPAKTRAGTYIIYYYTPGNTNYAEKAGSLKVTIARYDLNNASMSQEAMNYTGGRLITRPTVTVNLPISKDPIILEAEKDFSYSYGDNQNAGKDAGSITITGKENSNYAGSKTIKFNINKISNTLEIEGKKNLVYNSTAQILIDQSNVQGDIYYSIGTELTSQNYTTAKFKNTLPKETNAGNYTIYYYTPGNVNYNAEAGKVKATIEKYDLKNSEIEQEPLEYTGNAMKPTPEVVVNIQNKDNKTKLVAGEHFIFTYGENINAGENAGSITITAKENTNYKGTKTVKFAINKKENALEVRGKTGLVYNTFAQELVTHSNIQGDIYYSVGTELTEENYSTAGTKSIVPTKVNAGTYAVYYYTPGTTNYGVKSGKVDVTIEKYNLSNAKMEQGELNYTGEQLTPTPVVTVDIPSADKPTTLKAGKHFTFYYGANLDAGEEAGTVIITANDDSNYTGAKKVKFNINKIAATNMVKVVGINKVGYTLTAKVTTNSQGLKKYQWVKADDLRGTNRVDIKDAKEPTYTLKREDIGKCIGVIVSIDGSTNHDKPMDAIDFTDVLENKVELVALGGFTVTITPASGEYTGNTHNPTIIVKNSEGIKLSEDVHYTYSWLEDMKNVGTKTLEVTGKGIFEGVSATATYKINEASENINLNIENVLEGFLKKLKE